MSRIAVVLVLAWCSWAVGPLRAGVYNLAEKPLGPAGDKAAVAAIPFPLFKSQLADLLNIRNPVETPLRKHYLEQRAALAAKHRAGKATDQDQLNLSAYLIYIGETPAALEVLAPLAARDRAHYLVNANLITACQLAGELDRAVSLLAQVRGGRPQPPGATKEQIDWYARVESFHHKLITERYRESRGARSNRPVPPETVDDLFGVRFVGASGRYEAGQMAPDQKAKLPPDAIAIVQQLLVWLPEDTRLYWLLGELYNSQGDIRSAFTVFDDCRREGARRLDAAALREHRQIVQEALAKVPAAEAVPDSLADSVAPADESGESSGDWLPGWRQLALVGGLTAAAVIALAYFQFREFFRRGRGKPNGCCG